MNDPREFVIENGELRKYRGPGGDVTVPDGVKEIGWWCFAADTVKSLAIPDSVTVIQRDAFADNGKSLANKDGFCIAGGFLINYIGSAEDLVIPEGITHIVNVSAKTVKKVFLPATIKVIQGFSFRECPNLEEVIFADNTAGFRTIGCCAFSNCQKLQSINIPDSVRVVEWGAFDNCPCLNDENGVQTVGPVFYRGSKTDTDADISDGIRVIAEKAFCFSNLQSILLPDSLLGIGGEAFECSKLCSVTVPGSVETIPVRAFHNCGCLTSVTLSGGVKAIENEAFSGCTKLFALKLQEGLTAIGEEAFHLCKELKEAVIPDSVEYIGSKAFSYTGLTTGSIVLPERLKETEPDICFRLGIPDENYCLIKDRTLIGHRGGSSLTVTDGVAAIAENSLSRADTILLPDSVRSIEYSNNIQWMKSMNIPSGYLRQTEQLPAKALLALLQGPWQKTAEAEDIAAVYLCQKGKELRSYCQGLLEKRWKPAESAQAFLEFLREHGSAARFLSVAEFIWKNRKRIPQKTINEFYQLAVTAKATKAIALVKSIADTDFVQAEKPEKKTKKTDAANPIETFCSENYQELLLDKVCKAAEIPKTVFSGVFYRDSDVPVPSFVLKCAVVPYVDQLKEKPKHIGDYKSAYSDFEVLKDSDRIAKTFDPGTFSGMLEKMANIQDAYTKPQRMIPFCRFGTSKQISEAAAAMNKWADWNLYAASGRAAIIVTRGAMLLSDTREAMLYAEKNDILYEYAGMRGMDAETLRDTVLADFGLDESGKKTLDLGDTTVEITMNPDLSLSLYDTKAAKTVKSLPRKNADPQKYEKASAELSDMKKNLRKVTKARNDLLFDQFLYGGKRKADSWQKSYLKNPVLHKIAELIVWSQKKETFTVTEDGVIDCGGNPYTIRDDADITVAHPVSMKPEEIRAWQNYFTVKGLKQPFEQIWEPVYDPKTIMPDRYKGIMIPYYRFLKQPTIQVRDYDFHNDITITFQGCDAKVNRIDLARHSLDMNDRFEIVEISYGRRSGGGNHTIAYLDKITTMERIMKDDASIVDSLSRFTIAQITAFIAKAQEAKATNVLAVLLDYKNKYYPDLDPMEEFTLDW